MTTTTIGQAAGTVAQPWLAQVERIAEDVCQKLGVVFYDLEFAGTGGGRVLRIFVDRDGALPGVDDCANVSRGLNEILDTDETLIPGGAYSLEVSTPGIDRLLRKSWHFEKAVGKKIRIRSAQPMEVFGMMDPKWKNTKQIEEVLSAADNEAITFNVKEGALRVPYGAIEKAKIVFEEIKNKGPHKGSKHPKKS